MVRNNNAFSHSGLCRWRSRLSTLGLPLTEDAGWPEDQHEDEQAERDNILPLVREVDTREFVQEFPAHGLSEPEKVPSDHCPLNAADPSYYGGGEGLDPRQEAHCPADGAIKEAVQHTGNARHDRPKGERQHDRAVYIDAHEGGVIPVFGYC